MATVTLKCPAVRGKVTITNDIGDGETFVATCTGFTPIQIEGATLGQAVDNFMLNVGSLARSAEYTARQKINGQAASERMKEYHAKAQAKASRSNKNNAPSPETAKV